MEFLLLWIDDLDNHRILLLDGGSVPSYLQKNRNWLVEAGRNGKGPRASFFVVNNILGVMQACQRDLGIALLPDYLVEDAGLVQLFGEGDEIALCNSSSRATCFFWSDSR